MREDGGNMIPVWYEGNRLQHNLINDEGEPFVSCLWFDGPVSTM